MTRVGKGVGKVSGRESGQESRLPVSPLTEGEELRPPRRKRPPTPRVRAPIDLTDLEISRLNMETLHCHRTIERWAAGYAVEPATNTRIERAMQKLGIERREKATDRSSGRRRIVDVPRVA
jgi:hypothetical protein